MELNSLALTRLIDQFLNGELDEPDMQKIRSRMETNEQFREQVQLQQNLCEAIVRAGTRLRVQKVARSYHFKRLMKWVLIGLSLLISAVAIWVYANAASGESHSASVDMALREKLDEKPSFDRTPVQFFKGSGAEIFVSDKGILLSVVEGSFLENGKPYSGEYVIRLQEALDAAEIVRAGLNTKSGERSLRTKGMFAVHAFSDEGKPLEINPEKGLYVQVPVDEYDGDLRIFKGVKNGELIDWQSAKHLEKLPLPADMEELDFYPPGYEPLLDSLRWLKAKKSRDSLYLSFEDFRAVSEAAMMFAGRDTLSADMGGQLFDLKCASCHQLHKNSTGPKLAGVRVKWQKGGAKPGSIYDWVRNWSMAAANDPYAQYASTWSPTAMSFFEDLSNEEIDAIFDYVDGTGNSECGIPPSQVLGFWKNEFNNTLLATKDFEKRMQVIHETSDPKLLKLYLDNLKASMWRIDEFAADMGYPQFLDFAAEQVGMVNPDNPHLDNLAKLYRNSVNSLKQLDETRKKSKKRVEDAFDRKIAGLRENDARTELARNLENFRQEYNLNMNIVCKQLGKKNGMAIRTLTSASVGATVTGVGAYNLDAFVANATFTRKSATYTDPETGRTAKLSYTETRFEIENTEKLLKLYAYFVPDKLANFERIEAVDGTITRSLNDSIHYDLIIVGVGEDKLFTLTSGDPFSLNRRKVTLQAVSDKQLRDQLDKLLTNGSDHHNFKSQFKFWKGEQADYLEQKKRREEQRFRQQVRSRVFPGCYNSEQDFDQ